MLRQRRDCALRRHIRANQKAPPQCCLCRTHAYTQTQAIKKKSPTVLTTVPLRLEGHVQQSWPQRDGTITAHTPPEGHARSIAFLRKERAAGTQTGSCKSLLGEETASESVQAMDIASASEPVCVPSTPCYCAHKASSNDKDKNHH